MIVKDESHVIVETLKNLAHYIKFDTYAISDTGSTDATKALIKAFFDEQGISGDLYDDPWLHFGHNRSVAFQHAYQKADYAFVWDADDRIHGTFKLPATLEADSSSITFGAPGSTR
jgi:glycosyltransferase involved in cell wall biosynthesis